MVASHSSRCLLLFDTQSMIDDFENGNDDYISHSLSLFIDIIAIFKRILYLLLPTNNN